MLWPLFAVRTAWLAVLFAGIGVLVLWFLLRVFGDLIVWVKEEFFDDYKDLRKQAAETGRARQSGNASDSVRLKATPELPEKNEP